MATMLTHIKVEDYDAWRAMFDSDPVGARQTATGFQILRGVEDPSEVFIQVEFPSADDALTARQKLIDGGVLERVNVQSGPTLTERA